MNDNRAFLYGDAVSVYFFVRNGKLILTEECYFFLMASMRKMRMNIPLSFNLEYFIDVLEQKITADALENAFIHFLVYRNNTDDFNLVKSPVQFFIEAKPTQDILQISKTLEVDLIREITVNTNILSNILTHCPENIYAEIRWRKRTGRPADSKSKQKNCKGNLGKFPVFRRKHHPYPETDRRRLHLAIDGEFCHFRSQK